MEKEEGKKTMIFAVVEIGSTHPWQTIDTTSHSAQNTENKKKWPNFAVWFRVMGEVQQKNCVFKIFLLFHVTNALLVRSVLLKSNVQF